MMRYGFAPLQISTRYQLHLALNKSSPVLVTKIAQGLLGQFLHPENTLALTVQTKQGQPDLLL